MENRRQVEVLGLPMLDGLPRHEFVRAPDHFIDRPETKFGHDLAEFPRDEPHKIHDMVRVAGESRRAASPWVATPTGQVFMWQTRIMMQPSTTSGAVAKPNSSAPSNAAMTTSRPVFIWPSVST